MSEYYRKMNLKPETKIKIFDLIEKVESFVISKDVTANDSDFWCICEDKETELVSKRSLIGNTNRQLGTTLEEVESHIPELSDFFNEFKIYKYLGNNRSDNFNIHKHPYSPTSFWNLCIPRKNTNNSIVNFYRSKDISGLEDEFHHQELEESYPRTIVETIAIEEDSFYSFNVWNWHSFHIPHSNLVDVYLFHLKDAVTEEDIDRIIERIESFTYN